MRYSRFLTSRRSRGRTGFQRPDPGGPRGPRTPSPPAPAPPSPVPKPNRPPQRRIQVPKPNWRDYMDEVLNFAFDMSPQAQIIRRAQVIRYMLEYADKHGWLEFPEWMPWNDEQGLEWEDNGWILVCECPENGPPTLMSAQSIARRNFSTMEFYCQGNVCVGGQYVQEYDGGATYRMGFWAPDSPGRFKHVRSYANDTNDPYLPPPQWVVKKPIILPPVPVHWPSLNPDQLPIQQPVVDPKPLPWPAVKVKPKVNPWYKAGNNQPGPVAPVDPTTGLPPWMEPGPGVEINPDPETKPKPGGPAIPVIPVDAHPLTPPTRGEKERKVGGYPPALQKILSTITEADELVDAGYNALRKKCGGRGRLTMQAKLRCIYKNINYLDMDQFIRNVIENELEDRAIGGIAKYGKRVHKNALGNRPVSFGAGWAL